MTEECLSRLDIPNGDEADRLLTSTTTSSSAVECGLVCLLNKAACNSFYFDTAGQTCHQLQVRRSTYLQETCGICFRLCTVNMRPRTETRSMWSINPSHKLKVKVSYIYTYYIICFTKWPSSPNETFPHSISTNYLKHFRWIHNSR